MRDEEQEALLDALASMVAAGRHLTELGGRLLRASYGEPLSIEEREDASSEIASARDGIEAIHARLLLIRQQRRVM